MTDNTVKIKKRNNYFFYKIVIISAGIASLGTMPYGFKFAQSLTLTNHYLANFIGIIFAISAAIANTALGAHSFFNINLKQNNINPLYLALASFLSAIPTGFMCYFAYQPILPVPATLLMSCMVTIINAAIGYSAMLKFGLEIKSFNFYKFSAFEILSKFTGLLIGIGVSATVFMVSFNGFINLFNASHRDGQSAILLSYFIGFLTWVPTAALYSNTMQITVTKFCLLFTNFSRLINKMNYLDISLVIFSCCSGFSFAQITIDFFNPTMHIPTLLKSAPLQLFIYNFLVPLAFLSSASVNYFALKNIFSMKNQTN